MPPSSKSFRRLAALMALGVILSLPRPGRAENPPAPASMPLGIEDAVLMSLSRNHSLLIEAANPTLASGREAIARAAFDPVVTGSASTSQSRSRQESSILGQTFDVREERTRYALGLNEQLPTGTQVSVEVWNQRQISSLYGDYYTAHAGVSVTQSLLRGGGLDANLASLRQARLDTFASQYELKGFAEALAAEVEKTYWSLALTRKKLEIYRQALQVAEKNLRETEARVKVGQLPDVEMFAVQAETEKRRADLTAAQGEVDKVRLQLIRLINPEGPHPWDLDFALKLDPAIPAVELDSIGQHVQAALTMSPDLLQAKLLLQRGELEIARTKNGLLPKLDLFVTLGESGYADSFNTSWNNMNGDHPNAAAGVSFEYPLANRAAQAENHLALASRQQAEEAIGNLAQLVELDVRVAYLEIQRRMESHTAQASVVTFEEKKAWAEKIKFENGRSTSLLVAQADRDLLEARITEAEMVVDVLKAYVELFRLEGTLLERRGIATFEVSPS